MQAVIMAGGKGTRLRPLTCDIPKPMVPVMNRPILEHVLFLLKKHNIKDINITLMHIPLSIKNYFGNGLSHDLNLSYFTEEFPLGTAGSIKNAAKKFKDTFVVISGDCLTNIDLSKAIEYHKFKKSQLTICLTRVKNPKHYGIVITNNNGEIIKFLEKPNTDKLISDVVNTGIYIIEPEILSFIPDKRKFDFSTDLLPILMNKKVKMFGFFSYDYWADVGSVEEYASAHIDIFLNQKINNNVISIHNDYNDIFVERILDQNTVCVGKNTIIEEGAIINGPCCIGDNCYIEKNCEIGEYTVIGDNCHIQRNASIKRSIIWNNVIIENGCELRGSIICDNVVLKKCVFSFEKSIISSHTTVNERAVIKPGIKIWPCKIVDAYSLVDRNLVWGTNYTNKIFSSKNISGTINIDITPEFATRLATAYGSIQGANANIIISSSDTPAANMFKHAFIAGLMSSSVNVLNFNTLITPMARYAVFLTKAEGSIHIKNVETDPDYLQIDFYSKDGTFISEELQNQIQRIFITENYKRLACSKIPQVKSIINFPTYYLKNILKSMNINVIKANKINLVIASQSENLLRLINPALLELGCKVLSSLSISHNSIQLLCDEVKSTHADIGFFIDNNGEKLVIINKTGIMLSEQQTNLFFTYILANSIENPILYTSQNSSLKQEIIAKDYGVVLKQTNSPKSTIVNEVLKDSCFNKKFNQFHLFYDAPYAMFILIEFLCLKNKSLNDILNILPKIYYREKNIPCTNDIFCRFINNIYKIDGLKIVDLQYGVKLVEENGWVIITKRNKCPQSILLEVEGETQKDLDTLYNKYYQFLLSEL